VKHDSGDEQALVKIQHDWAEARLKSDNSFVKMRGEWKAVASQVTPVLEK